MKLRGWAAAAVVLAAVAMLVAAMVIWKPWRAGTPVLSTQWQTYRELPWTQLMPAGWNPLQRYRDQNIAALRDGDPRVTAMMRELREIWANAPVVDALDGAAVQLTGYIVPLDNTADGLKTFLLVPYFGACIHSPPPPANQIVEVELEQRQPMHSMDTVRVWGVLQIERQDTSMGMSAYRMRAGKVEPYRAP